MKSRSDQAAAVELILATRGTTSRNTPTSIAQVKLGLLLHIHLSSDSPLGCVRWTSHHGRRQIHRTGPRCFGLASHWNQLHYNEKGPVNSSILSFSLESEPYLLRD